VRARELRRVWIVDGSIGLLAPGGHDARVSPPAVVTSDRVVAAKRQGGGLHVWTAYDPAPMPRLSDLGVDEITTDRPAFPAELPRQRSALGQAERPGPKVRDRRRS